MSRLWIILTVLALAGCHRTANEAPPVTASPESSRVSDSSGLTRPILPPMPQRKPDKHAIAVSGTRYDLQRILVPGSVTIVKFTAPW